MQIVSELDKLVLAAFIAETMKDEEVLEFLLAVDQGVSDWEFTESLLSKILSQFVDNEVPLEKKKTQELLFKCLKISQEGDSDDE